ncbi:MAG: hypothetical protein ABIR71_00595 [Chthoniobacterales bacterium]
MSKFVFRTLFAVALLTLAACGRPQPVVLVDPGEDDLVLLNGCVVSACNYLAITKARHKLEPDYWAKVLLVRFENNVAGHAYCVWETEGTIYGYDRNSGGFQIPIYTRDPRTIAIVLAQELSKYMKEPLVVRSADFVEPNNAELYAYSIGGKSTMKPPALLSTAPFPARSLSLNSAVDPFATK